MRIIVDQDIHFLPAPTELGLDAETVVDYLAPGIKLGSEDCVILFTSMVNGFHADHLRLFMNNPDVARWIVVLIKQDYIISEKKIMGALNGLNVQGDVIPCYPYDTEAVCARLRELLERATIVKRSCLIYSRSEAMDPAPLAKLLEDILPDWDFETQTGGDLPLDSGHGYIIIAGWAAWDFNELPDSILSRALLVLVQIPGNVQISRRRDALNQLILKHSGTDWSMDVIRQRTFIINPQYEVMRRVVQKNPAAAISLRNDPSFVMWDQFKLPLNRSQYTGDAIREFLKDFNECERLAAYLRN